MSLFNLDRFRFDKNKATSNQDEYSGSVSPESEKENKPARGTTPIANLGKPGRGVVFEDVISDSDDLASDSRRDKLTKVVKEPVKKQVKVQVREMTEPYDKEDQVDKELEERLDKLQEIFPKRNRKELLEVIESTSTLDGAVASCLMMFGDKDSMRKRKPDGSSSCRDKDVVQQPSKRRRPSLAEDSEDSEEEGAEPSWERQEAMVRKLQRKFPDQDKEKELFHKEKGLSVELLLGCRAVLRERAVVQGLMSKCQNISGKMAKGVNQVIDKGMGSVTQPSILNRKLKLKPYQLIGLKWLLLLHQHKLSGILADEMHCHS